MTKQYEPHPFANIFPMLEGDAFQAFVEDIKARGQQEPIWIYEGMILEGRNRYRACQILKLEIQERPYLGNDPMGFVLSANLHRRHLNESQRAMIGANLTTLVVGANQHTKGGLSASAAAALLNVGVASIARAKLILGDPKLTEEVTQGKTTVSAASQKLKSASQKLKEQGADTKSDADAPPEPKPPKPPKNLSDKVDRLIEALVKTLKEYQEQSEESAMAATAILIKQLAAARLIEAKGKKAA